MARKQGRLARMLRLILSLTLAAAAVVAAGEHDGCSSSENELLHRLELPLPHPAHTDTVDIGAWSQEMVLPWAGTNWCEVSPCLTVTNATLREIELPRYKKWLATRVEVNAAPFAPLVYEQQNGTIWRAPTRHLSYSWRLRNASHAFKSTLDHIAPLNAKTECSFWVNATGSLLLWYNFFPSDNYGHWLHDHAIPLYALLELLGSSVSWVALPESDLTRRWLCWFDPALLRRVLFYPLGECICTNATTMVSVPRFIGAHGWTGPPGASVLNQKAFESHCKGGSCSGRPAVVFASRSPKTTHHGRMLVNEDDVISAVRQLMQAYNRPEELVIYTGENVSHAEQFQLFSRASVIMGPHGSAMANALWAASSEGCKDPVHVVEFIGGSISGPRIQGQRWARTYYVLDGGVPWVNYHHVVFEANSTTASTSVNVADVEAVLSYIWGGVATEATTCFAAAWGNH